MVPIAKNKQGEKAIPAQCEVKEKCYISITPLGWKEELDVMGLFNGAFDERFASVRFGSGKPSSLFWAMCKLFKTQEDALSVRQRYGAAENSTYVLEAHCSAKEVKEHAAQGNFSSIIINAINVKDHTLGTVIEDPNNPDIRFWVRETVYLLKNILDNTLYKHLCVYNSFATANRITLLAVGGEINSEEYGYVEAHKQKGVTIAEFLANYTQIVDIIVKAGAKSVSLLTDDNLDYEWWQRPAGWETVGALNILITEYHCDLNAVWTCKDKIRSNLDLLLGCTVNVTDNGISNEFSILNHCKSVEFPLLNALEDDTLSYSLSSVFGREWKFISVPHEHRRNSGLPTEEQMADSNEYWDRVIVEDKINGTHWDDEYNDIIAPKQMMFHAEDYFSNSVAFDDQDEHITVELINAISCRVRCQEGNVEKFNNLKELLNKLNKKLNDKLILIDYETKEDEGLLLLEGDVLGLMDGCFPVGQELRNSIIKLILQTSNYDLESVLNGLKKRDKENYTWECHWSGLFRIAFENENYNLIRELLAVVYNNYRSSDDPFWFLLQWYLQLAMKEENLPMVKLLLKYEFTKGSKWQVVFVSRLFYVLREAVISNALNVIKLIVNNLLFKKDEYLYSLIDVAVKERNLNAGYLAFQYGCKVSGARVRCKEKPAILAIARMNGDHEFVRYIEAAINCKVGEEAGKEKIESVYTDAQKYLPTFFNLQGMDGYNGSSSNLQKSAIQKYLTLDKDDPKAIYYLEPFIRYYCFSSWISDITKIPKPVIEIVYGYGMPKIDARNFTTRFFMVPLEKTNVSDIHDRMSSNSI